MEPREMNVSPLLITDPPVVSTPPVTVQPLASAMNVSPLLITDPPVVSTPPVTVQPLASADSQQSQTLTTAQPQAASTLPQVTPAHSPQALGSSTVSNLAAPSQTVQPQAPNTSHSPSSNHPVAPGSLTVSAEPRTGRTSGVVVSPPPSYSGIGPPQQTIFMPYVTQHLPSYDDVLRDERSNRRSHGEIRLGFAHQSGGDYVPVEIPGYISTEDHDRTHYTVPTRVTRVRVQRSPERDSSSSAAPSDDSIKCTFMLVLCCILYLNLPAVLMTLSALGCLMKARDLSTDRRNNAEVKRCNKLALFCNASAVIGHFAIIVIAFIVLATIFVSDISLFSITA